MKTKTKPDLTMLGKTPEPKPTPAFTPIQKAERIVFLLALIVLALDLLIWRP
jgi:hypothetical protein